MRSDRRLKHFGETLRGALRPEALNAEAGAFTQQEQLIGDKLGIAQPRLAAELDDQIAIPALVFLDHAPPAP